EATRRTKWIVVQIGERPVGLVVDSVTDVFGAGEPDQRSVPEIGVGDAARGIAAVYSHGGRLVFVLDIDRIAAVAEVLDVSAMKKAIAKESAR
ncbi:MAG: chemotaxis protein CheW, partial [Sandaracinaceae bacterium]|nr:chemotaxis protein CheW [Sandaracinaceae bacterium]